jgi:hypothetical protein
LKSFKTAIVSNEVKLHLIPLSSLWGDKNRGEMMKLRFGEEISAHQLTETSKRSSLGKTLAQEGLQIIF